MALRASVPILCYHDVGPAVENGRRLNVEPDRLAAHIRLFKRRSRRFVRASELGNAERGCVCFTFDDGFAGALSHGVRTLLAEGVTASFYPVANRVGQESDWDPAAIRPLADWDLLVRASRDGMEIGNHTANHSDLSTLHLDQQIEELSGAAATMRNHGFDCLTACLPYGAWNLSTPAALKRCGIETCLALGRRAARPADSPLLLPRIVLSYGDGPMHLLYKLHVKPLLPVLRKRAHYVD